MLTQRHRHRHRHPHSGEGGDDGAEYSSSTSCDDDDETAVGGAPSSAAPDLERGRLLWNTARLNAASIKQQYRAAKGEFKAHSPTVSRL